jgi:hypothetical protein
MLLDDTETEAREKQYIFSVRMFIGVSSMFL